MAITSTISSKAILVILVVSAVAAAGYAMSHTVSAFLLAFVFAYLLDPFVAYLEGNRVPRVWGIVVLYLILSFMALFAITFILPLVTERWNEFLRDFPIYLQKGKELGLAWKASVMPPSAGEEWRWIFDSVTGHAEKLAGKLGAGAYAAAASVVFNLFNLVLAPILIFFMLFYKKKIAEGIVSYLPPARREMLITLGREVNASIGGYIRGQMLVSLIVAILSILALFILDVDYPILNGIFAGVASILPFIGVILATIMPLFFAYVKFQSLAAIAKVIIAFAIIYFVEGYVIKPLVFKKAMELNPLTTILVVMAFGELLGFWGILLAIPIAAAFKIVVEHVRHGDFSQEEANGGEEGQ